LISFSFLNIYFFLLLTQLLTMLTRSIYALAAALIVVASVTLVSADTLWSTSAGRAAAATQWVTINPNTLGRKYRSITHGDSYVSALSADGKVVACSSASTTCVASATASYLDAAISPDATSAVIFAVKNDGSIGMFFNPSFIHFDICK
jgi:hypothetical protein